MRRSREEERKNRRGTLASFLTILGSCVILLSSCRGDSGSSAAPTELVYLKISTNLSSSKVDVNPARNVVAENIVLQGMARVREYRVAYFREDGQEVPDPFVVHIDQSSVTSGDGLKIEKLLLIRKEALQEVPFVPYPDANAPLELGALLEFFGEDEKGTSVSGQVVFSLVCADF